jgi:ribosomal-protein-alanine N-acetyltransferase
MATSSHEQVDARTDEDLEVQLVPMRRRHLRGVLRIEGQGGPRGWSLGLFMGELANEAGRRYLVARAGGSVVGFAGMLFVGTDGHVTTIAVDEAHRRRQIGTRLMVALSRDAIERGATALTLEVRAGNEPAQAMYRRFGFAPAGIRRNYYPDTGEDALVMWAHDVDAPAYAERLDRIESGVRGVTRLDHLSGPPRLDGPGVVVVDRPGDGPEGSATP